MLRLTVHPLSRREEPMNTELWATAAAVAIPLLILATAALTHREEAFRRYEVALGGHQYYFARAGATRTLRRLLRAEPGARVRITGNDLRKAAADREWCDFLKKLLEKGVKISVYVSRPTGGELKELRELREAGLELKETPEVGTEHWVWVDRPRQLWFERVHEGNLAHDCVYTEEPEEQVWKDVGEYFDRLDRNARPVEAGGRPGGVA